MTSHIPENFSTWLVDWSLVTIMGDAMPPRDPNDDDDDEDEQDEEDEHRNDEPAVVRETNSAPRASVFAALTTRRGRTPSVIALFRSH
jgi:hypothetical protein